MVFTSCYKLNAGSSTQLVARGENHSITILAESIDRYAISVVSNQFAHVRISCSCGSSRIGAVYVTMVVVLAGIGIICLSLVSARRGTTWTSRTTRTSTTSSHVSWCAVAKTGVKTGSFIGQSQATIRVGEIIEECSSSNCQANCSQAGVSEGSALDWINGHTDVLPSRTS